MWQPIDGAPKDQFVLVYCPEDRSTWVAKWQGGEWYGVDDDGLTRTGHAPSPEFVTGWEVTLWLPIPKPQPEQK
jgi:hypothetical protein